jgi:hypothetical protein
VQFAALVAALKSPSSPLKMALERVIFVVEVTTPVLLDKKRPEGQTDL